MIRTPLSSSFSRRHGCMCDNHNVPLPIISSFSTATVTVTPSPPITTSTSTAHRQRLRINTNANEPSRTNTRPNPKTLRSFPTDSTTTPYFSLLLLLLLVSSVPVPTVSFLPPTTTHRPTIFVPQQTKVRSRSFTTSTTAPTIVSSLYGTNVPDHTVGRRNITLPLLLLDLDLHRAASSSSSSSSTNKEEDDDDDEPYILPLPSSHLPDELTTLNIYGIRLTSPVHKQMVRRLLESRRNKPMAAGRGGGGGGVVTPSTIVTTDGLDSEDRESYGHVAVLRPKTTTTKKESNGSDGVEEEEEEDGSGLVGAIGCVAQVLISAMPLLDLDSALTENIDPNNGEEPDMDRDEEEGGNGDGAAAAEEEEEEEEKVDRQPLDVLVRGRFRFVVREVISTFPVPVAIVDELIDEDHGGVGGGVIGGGGGGEAAGDNSLSVLSSSTSFPESESLLSTSPNMIIYEDELGLESRFDDNEDYDIDDDDEDYDIDDDDDDEDDYLNDSSTYSDLTSPQLIERLTTSIHTLIESKLSSTLPPPPTPLSVTLPPDPILAQLHDKAQETAATFDAILSELDDTTAPSDERALVLGYIGLEVAEAPNDIRRRALAQTDRYERLRLVLTVVDRALSRANALKLSETLVAKTDEESRDLKVGVPVLPPWAKQIRKGTELEYYWNEEYEWCGGVVVEEPRVVKGGKELELAILFDGDDQVYRLPFQGDEKARWRPKQR